MTCLTFGQERIGIPLFHRLTIAIAAVSAIGGCARTIPLADSSIANGITSPLNTDVLLGSDADQPATTVPKATRTPSREHVAITGSDYVQGRSRVLVQAPIATVRRRVLKFRDYAKFMPHYRASVVLGKLPDGNKRVYMQVAALRGMVKMGAEIAIGKVRKVGTSEVYASRFIKGKRVKMFKAVWRLKPVDAQTTELWLDVLLQPSVPLPTGLVNDENIKGAAKGVAAMRDRIEGKAAK